MMPSKRKSATCKRFFLPGWAAYAERYLSSAILSNRNCHDIVCIIATGDRKRIGDPA